MPVVKQFYWDQEGPALLEVSWGIFWRNIKVKFDGVVILSLDNKAALEEGREVSLTDGTIIKVQLVQESLNFKILAFKNGQPLQEKDTGPAEKLKIAYGAIFFVAIMGMSFGLIVELFQIKAFLDFGIGWLTFVYGLVFLILGIFVKKRSLIALVLAVTLFVVDALYTIAFALKVSTNIPVVPIVVRVLFTFQMIQGFGAILALKEQEKVRPTLKQ
ncbi:MAG: hypothetical protein K1Y36_15675 [Blastocatellia bacterium]|nr:hypothetical protein [Blastocatellia bacterium]